MEPRSPSLAFSLQQMPYAFVNPANAYSSKDDKLTRSDRELFVSSRQFGELMITVKLTRPMKPNPKPGLKDAPQSSLAQVQFDPPSKLTRKQEICLSDPVFLAVLNERSKKMADDGWMFNAEKLSCPASAPFPLCGSQLTPNETDWLQSMQLAQVVREKRARQAAADQRKQSLTWETSDLNSEDCELFNHESLDEELNAFYGPSRNDCSKNHGISINDEGFVDDNAEMSTAWANLPANHSFQPGSFLEFQMNPNEQFADSGISVDDHFPADFRNQPTTGIDSGDLFSDGLDQFFPEDITMEDFSGAQAPSAMPTFAVQEASEADRNFLRSLYCNNNGVGESLLDAPYDLEGFATDEVNQNQDVGSSYDPESFCCTHDTNLSYSEKTQYALPGEFLGHHILPPPRNTVIQQGLVNSNPVGTTNPTTSTQVTAPDVSKQSVATSKEAAMHSPDRSAAAGDQLLTNLHANTKSTMGNSTPSSTPSISAASESSSDIVTSLPVCITSHLPQQRSKTLPSPPRTNLIPDYSSESESEHQHSDDGVKVLPSSYPTNLTKPGASTVDPLTPDSSARDFSGVKVLPFSSPIKLTKPGASTVNHLIHDNSATDIDEIIARDFQHELSRLSTPTNRGRSGPKSIIQADTLLNDPNSPCHYYAYHTVATPSAAGPSAPTTPATPSFLGSSPYQSSYPFSASPTPRPRITTILRGHVLSTPKNQKLNEHANRAKRARARKASATAKAAAANHLIHDNSATEIDEIIARDFQHELSRLSTPANRGRSGLKSVIQADTLSNDPNSPCHYYAYQTVATPSAAGSPTPTTPATPSLPGLFPYQSSYPFSVSPTPRPRITTILRGQVLSTPKNQKMVNEYANMAKRIRARARKAAAAKEAAKPINSGEEPPAKKIRRSKPKNAEIVA
ncbi:hypothetical protein MMC29_006114 [Sticta canariensis]|nr:hypothetical protein [Sticta canariensis]